MSMHASAQTDSVSTYSVIYSRIIGKADWAVGKLRGFKLGDSIATILGSEKAILEAQGDDFLYYRVLCDSALSAEISYTFDEKGLLISIGIEFFEMCKGKDGYLSDRFLMHFRNSYANCMQDETGIFQCKSETGVRLNYQKTESKMCVIHTQIEFY